MSAAVFFVVGSIGMLIGSTGYMLVENKTCDVRNRGHEPYRMATLRKTGIDTHRVWQSAGPTQYVASATARGNGSGPG